MTVWPSTLPLPRVDYQGAPRLTTLISRPQSATIHRRSRFKPLYAGLEVTWRLTQSQYTAFKTFFDDTLGNGASLFELELRYPENSSLTEWVVRFTNSHQALFTDGIWTVTAVLDIVRLVALPAEAGLVGTSGFYAESETSGGDAELFTTVDGNDFYVKDS